MSIHSTAVISSKAQISSTCHIGPYCVIEGNVTLGEGCKLESHVVIKGETHIGKDNHFFSFSCIGEKTQDLKYQGEPTFLSIGNGNTFREGVTVHRSTDDQNKTRIGNGNFFLAYAHIGHDCKVGDHCVFSNGVGIAGHVIIGDHVVIGGFAGVHQFCRIGDHAFLAAGMMLESDMLPYSIYSSGNRAKLRGINVVGLKRHSFSEEEIGILKKFYFFIKKERGDFQDLILKFEEISEKESPLISKIKQFASESSRGISIER